MPKARASGAFSAIGQNLPPYKRPITYTLLDKWLKARQIPDSVFAGQLGCDLKMITYWRQGQCMPDLVYAFRIERQTQGGVPVASWLGTPMGRALWHDREETVRGA
jgi:hypothetical protein